MAVRQRGESWQADVTYKGKRLRQDFDTKLAADTWESETKAKLLRGEEVKVERNPFAVETMSDVLDKVDKLVWSQNRSRADSVANAKDVLKTLDIEKLRPHHLTTDHVDRLVEKLQERGLTGATINRKLAALSKLCKFAHSRGWMPKPPVIDLREESEHRIRYLTEAEEAKALGWLEQAAYNDMADLVTLLVDTGLRLSEAVDLEFRDVTAEQVMVPAHKAKGKKNRGVPMTGRVAKLLDRRLKERLASLGAGSLDEVSPDSVASPRILSHVFPDMDVSRAERVWEKLRSWMKMSKDGQFVLHALRHTFCSRLVQRGVPLQVVQELAGHATITTTQRYAHLAQSNKVDAIRKLESKRINSVQSAAATPVTNCDGSPKCDGVLETIGVA